MSAALRFPGQQPDDASKKKARELSINAKQAPVFESFSPEHAESLLAITKHVFERALHLMGFVDTSRDLAKEAGVETITLELASILDAGRLDRVRDALERAVVADTPAQISLEGLQLLRRSERLIAEAADSVRRFAAHQLAELSSAETNSRRDTELRQAREALEERRLELLRDEHRIAELATVSRIEARREAIALASAAAPTPPGGQGIPWEALGVPEPRLAPVRSLDASEYAVSAPPAEESSSSWVGFIFGLVGISAAVVMAILLGSSESDPSARRRER